MYSYQSYWGERSDYSDTYNDKTVNQRSHWYDNRSISDREDVRPYRRFDQYPYDYDRIYQRYGSADFYDTESYKTYSNDDRNSRDHFSSYGSYCPERDRPGYYQASDRRGGTTYNSIDRFSSNRRFRLKNFSLKSSVLRNRPKARLLGHSKKSRRSSTSKERVCDDEDPDASKISQEEIEIDMNNDSSLSTSDRNETITDKKVEIEFKERIEYLEYMLMNASMFLDIDYEFASNVSPEVVTTSKMDKKAGLVGEKADQERCNEAISDSQIKSRTVLESASSPRKYCNITNQTHGSTSIGDSSCLSNVIPLKNQSELASSKSSSSSPRTIGQIGNIASSGPSVRNNSPPSSNSFITPTKRRSRSRSTSSPRDSLKNSRLQNTDGYSKDGYVNSSNGSTIKNYHQGNGGGERDKDRDRDRDRDRERDYANFSESGSYRDDGSYRSNNNMYSNHNAAAGSHSSRPNCSSSNNDRYYCEQSGYISGNQHFDRKESSTASSPRYSSNPDNSYGGGSYHDNYNSGVGNNKSSPNTDRRVGGRYDDRAAFDPNSSYYGYPASRYPEHQYPREETRGDFSPRYSGGYDRGNGYYSSADSYPQPGFGYDYDPYDRIHMYRGDESRHYHHGYDGHPRDSEVWSQHDVVYSSNRHSTDLERSKYGNGFDYRESQYGGGVDSYRDPRDYRPSSSSPRPNNSPRSNNNASSPRQHNYSSSPRSSRSPRSTR